MELSILTKNKHSSGEKKLNTLFIEAAKKGDFKTIKETIEQGADINFVPKQTHDNALVWAIVRENLQIISYLLNKGIDVNFINTRGNTALIYAILLNNFDAVELLCEQFKADVNLCGRQAYPPLHRAVMKENLMIVKFLLNKGALINRIDFDGNTVLAYAVASGNFEIVKYLLDKGANICKVGKNGDTPLVKAVKAKNMKMLQYLLDHGAEFTIHSALYTAIEEQLLDFVELLVERGASVDIIYRNGYSPLTKATETNNLQIVHFLGKHGAKIDMFDGNGYTALTKSMQHHDFEITEYLIEKGANVNVYDNITGFTPLISFIEMSNIEAVKYLVEKGADVNMPDKDGDSPLMRCIKRGNFYLFEYLANHGADLNQVDANGKTLLSLAVLHEDFPISAFLIHKGADVRPAAKYIRRFAAWNDDFNQFLKSSVMNWEEIDASCESNYVSKVDLLHRDEAQINSNGNEDNVKEVRILLDRTLNDIK